MSALIERYNKVIISCCFRCPLSILIQTVSSTYQNNGKIKNIFLTRIISGSLLGCMEEESLRTSTVSYYAKPYNYLGTNFQMSWSLMEGVGHSAMWKSLISWLWDVVMRLLVGSLLLNPETITQNCINEITA